MAMLMIGDLEKLLRNLVLIGQIVFLLVLEVLLKAAAVAVVVGAVLPEVGIKEEEGFQNGLRKILLLEE
jgi:hypothetical protein